MSRRSRSFLTTRVGRMLACSLTASIAVGAGAAALETAPALAYDKTADKFVIGRLSAVGIS